MSQYETSLLTHPLTHLIRNQGCHGREKTPPCRNSLKGLAYSNTRFRLLFVLANLIADRAGCLAGALAGCLALTASALLQGVLKGSGIQSLNVLHNVSLLCDKILSYYSIAVFIWEVGN